MTNAQRPIVNQRLYFCRLHLGYLCEQLDKQQTARAVLEQSLGESIVLHLMLAYRAYLQEIAAAYTIPVTEFATSQALITALSDHQQQSAEAMELSALERDGWLCDLFARYQTLGAPASRSRSQSGSGIAVTQIEQSDTLDASLCEYYFQSLSELIDSQRARLEEW